MCCARCGAQLEDGVKFCTHCGARVKPLAAMAPASGDGTTMGAELGSLRISGSYDPLGEAGKAAVAAKRGEASGGDFMRSIPTRAAR
ncbi:zinc ribbon domain-containing protein [uncultured Parolsenella sp.]|uniref:zinc ribbon domain-containing protein n=1 Tax=uncultured Parolsenella sp. TaxID=2083008 RepID=UPI0025DACF6F|nr:zinc ribbon domain-containing protein [uncultured Parolsenella sp.]